MNYTNTKRCSIVYFEQQSKLSTEKHIGPTLAYTRVINDEIIFVLSYDRYRVITIILYTIHHYTTYRVEYNTHFFCCCSVCFLLRYCIRTGVIPHKEHLSTAVYLTARTLRRTTTIGEQPSSREILL